MVEFTDRLRYYGVKWVGTAVECVTSYGGDGNDVEDAIYVIGQWDSSPSHKEGMLEKDVTRVGISLVGVYWEKHISYTYEGRLIERTHKGIRYFATLLLVS